MYLYAFILYGPFVILFEIIKTIYKNKLRKFSTMDILVPITMKSAAKCDKQCELQNSANHQILERNWR